MFQVFQPQQPKVKSFKEQFPLEQRIDKCKTKLSQYPEMIPLIVEKHHKSKLPNLQKQIYLVTKDFKFPQFRLVLRKNFTLNDKTNIFFYQGAHLVAEDTNIKDIYNSRKDKQDGFLYLTYSDMEVFGSLTNH